MPDDHTEMDGHTVHLGVVMPESDRNAG